MSQDQSHKCSHQKVEEAVKLLRRGVSLNKRQNNWKGIWPSEEVVSDSVRQQPVKTKTNMSNEALKGPDTIAHVCVRRSRSLSFWEHCGGYLKTR